jgi:hypothetical protein
MDPVCGCDRQVRPVRQSDAEPKKPKSVGLDERLVWSILDDNPATLTGDHGREFGQQLRDPVIL